MILGQATSAWLGKSSEIRTLSPLPRPTTELAPLPVKPSYESITKRPGILTQVLARDPKL